MSQSPLEKLGLTVRDTEGGQETDLELVSLQLINPLTRKFLTKVTFTVLGERLIVTEPPELVGIPPVSLASVNKPIDLEQHLGNSLNEHIFHVQRRSAELQALGFSPRVDPETLTLSAEIAAGSSVFVIATDKRGNFRVISASRDGADVPITGTQVFELSEFRERAALEGYLSALLGDSHPKPASKPEPVVKSVTFGEIANQFGLQALLPPRSSLEILMEVRVNGDLYRFAAARVMGRTFRGLLAGSSGKIWSERFELEQFPGVVQLVSQVLGVPVTAVEVPKT